MYCSECRTQNPDDASKCSRCGAVLWPYEQSSPAPQEYGAGVRLLVPVGRSWVAILAGYLGLLSVALVPAPLAVVAGICALVHLKRNPKLHGHVRAWFAIVIGALGSVLLVVWLTSR